MCLLQQSRNPYQDTYTSTNFAGDSDFLSSDCSLFACLFSSMVDKPWIIDSGATNHMTPHKSLLSQIIPLAVPYLITLPNSYKVKVTCTVSLSLANGPTLLDVLLVPSFHHNLISLHKLLQQLNCTAHFSSNYCLLQGPSLKRPLALGKLSNGLYILNVELLPQSPRSEDVEFTSNPPVIPLQLV